MAKKVTYKIQQEFVDGEIIRQTVTTEVVEGYRGGFITLFQGAMQKILVIAKKSYQLFQGAIFVYVKLPDIANLWHTRKKSLFEGFKICFFFICFLLFLLLIGEIISIIRRLHTSYEMYLFNSRFK